MNKARVSIYLSGCDVHWYYKANVYDPDPEPYPPAQVNKWLWDLVPYFDIKCEYGRIICGNPSLPYSLTFHLSDANFVYKKPNLNYRQSMEGRCHSFEVNFIPTDGYEGERTDPPYPETGRHPRHAQFNETQKKQYTENGIFTVCFSKKASVNYYWDLLPNQVQEDEVEFCSRKPEWGVSMQLSNNTTINWGPWCDRQRERIWKFYNPVDYKTWQYPNEPVHEIFKYDIGFSSKLDSKRERKRQDGKRKNKLNIEFIDEKKNRKSIQLQVQEGSFLKMEVPYIPTNNSFSQITGRASFQFLPPTIADR